MSGDKVKLPREVADVMEVLSETESGQEMLHDIPYMIRCEKDGHPDGTVFEPIVKFYQKDSKNKIAYIQALVNGYEVEETPEDRVRAMFKEAYREEVSSSYNGYIIRFWEGRRMAIIDVLNTLGIKIEGVNA